MSAPRGAPGAVNVSTSTAKHRPSQAPGNFLWVGKSRASYQQREEYGGYGVIVVDVLRLAKSPYCALFLGRGSREEASVYRLSECCWPVPGAQTASAASAPPLTQLKVLKVESPACGFEDIAEGQEQTRCNHSGPNIKVYVLEIGYGREPHVGLDGFDVNGTRLQSVLSIMAT
jgi:hypothetical protein